MNTEIIQESAKAACTLLKAMSNENRLMILCQLATGEKTVRELEEIIGISQSALSQHLAILRSSTVVNTRRNAQNIYYSLAEPQPRAVIETLYRLYSKNI
ncbi:MAG: metalloregulator ArsR/SmtB family transcription factor [Rhodospirillales bacterium]|nr:metalloregulator ArsR/SmtB family transcription factor [Rhodospirillales bacterium]